MHLQLKFIVVNKVEKLPHDIQWPMNHLPNHKNNYIFIYFGMLVKMNDINILIIFSFIQIDISCKFKLHIQLQTTF
jgi:hypothetical protein